MKALITGGAGFIASHVTDLYLKHGFQVVIVDDLSTGRLSNVNPAAKLYNLDIRSPQLARAVAKETPAAANHHSALINVRGSESDPLFHADVNVVCSLPL